MRESQGPWAGKQMQLRAPGSTSPAAARSRRGSLALLSPRVAPGKRAWLHSPPGPGGGGAGQERAISAILSLQILPFLRGPRVLPRGGALGPHVAACHLSHISWGCPLSSFPVRVGEGLGGTFSVQEAQAVQLTEEKATSCLLLPNLPNPGEIQEEALMMEGW